MFHKALSYSRIIYYLLLTELQLTKKTIKDRVINLFIWTSINLTLVTYIFPSFGIHANFISVTLAGVFSAAGLFEVYPSAFELVSDLEHTHITNFYLILPFPSWMAFVHKIIFYMLNVIFVTLTVIPLGLAITYGHIALANIQLFKLAITMLTSSIFFACITIWLVSRNQKVKKIRNLFMRFIFPAWFLGGFQFTWHTLYSINSWLSYIVLLNPVIYITENMRTSLLGDHTGLPFSLCVIVTYLFTVVFLCHAMRSLKKNLDFC